MSTLLEDAVLAHGGIGNWKKHRAASASLDIGGAIWQLKGQPNMFRDIELDASLEQQHVSMTSQTAGWKGVFTPDRVSIELPEQHRVEQRDAPRTSYADHTQETQWDQLHALYFCGYALWSYLSIPFLYTYPGFETEEQSEWEENGEVWRRLKVTFPDSIASHSREQISYFGEDGLLRRHDYTVDVMGGARGANYASNYRDVGGIMIPMSRRVFAYDDTGRKIDDPLLVSIDFHDVAWRDN
ncbi:hypothetical protein [Paraburkholderia haematera]|uniref:Uncharacterized protein n=1 Tax=Paraburkholderia haematera TaxID=2793077 RepID=A0ABN7MI90_9BURK|nr:hypothetical protein [Paraburkholderia haematera]CAE6808068.1 hypothetical protein R69888_05527 [Paraburkholderia haematera]